MRFIDLFAGLGGFHLALRRLGHRCVFACEIDETLRRVYENNFGIAPQGDILKVQADKVPHHDILCAGFPCQPFSKAGSQSGLQDPKWGGLFYEILRIIQHHKPRYLLLENVANFERHDNGRTWEAVEGLLRGEGYDLTRRILSPHHFGIPQIRERIYIVGRRDTLNGFEWPPLPSEQTTVQSILDPDPPDGRRISQQVKSCIEVWQEFLDRFPQDEKLPSFPIWSMEFGATYPYEDTTPYATSLEELRAHLGSHGRPIVGTTRDELLQHVPSHARTEEPRFPRWKVKFIEQNRQLYERHKSWIDEWKSQIMPFPSSFQKLEWNCQGEPRQLRKFIIQIRASGVRVKRPTTAPSLVAMTATQVPIITWEERYMTPTECKRLQSMDDLRWLPDTPTMAYQALGNAVNVRVAEFVAKTLLHPTHPKSRRRYTEDRPQAQLVAS